MVQDASERRTLLHVGCGPKRIEQTLPLFNKDAWREVRLDIDKDVNPDVIGSMTAMPDVRDESVDAVFSSHNVEHLFPHEVPIALGEFRRVLKAGGFAIITCPDLQSVCAMVAQGKLTDVLYQSGKGPITPLDVIYGHRASIAAGNNYMAHKGGFVAKYLTDSLRGAGFQSTGLRRRPKDFDMWAVAFIDSEKPESIQSFMNQYIPV